MNIKELRNKTGISQQELADEIGVPKSRLAQWEVNKAKPKSRDHQSLINFFIKKGVLEPTESNHAEYNLGSAIKKMEAITEVSLAAIAEVLAKLSDRSVTAVRDELQDLVNKRLNS